MLKNDMVLPERINIAEKIYEKITHSPLKTF